MNFKSPELQNELAKTPALLQTMAVWFRDLCIAHFGIDPVVTRIFEAINGSSGVHEAGRAVDFRDEHSGVRTFSDEQVAFLISEMNRRFPRHDKKSSCIHHSFQGGMLHFHVQVGLPGVTEDVGLDCNPLTS